MPTKPRTLTCKQKVLKCWYAKTSSFAWGRKFLSRDACEVAEILNLVTTLDVGSRKGSKNINLIVRACAKARYLHTIGFLQNDPTVSKLLDVLAHACLMLLLVLERAFSPLFTRLSKSAREKPDLLADVLKFGPLLDKMKEFINLAVAVLSPFTRPKNLAKLREAAEYYASQHFLFLLVQNRELKTFHIHFKVLAKNLLLRRCCETQCPNLRQEGYSVFCVLHHQRIVEAPALWFFIPENVDFPSFKKFGEDYLPVFMCHRDCIKYRQTKEKTERIKQALYMLDLYMGSKKNELHFEEEQESVVATVLLAGVKAKKFNTALFLPLERHVVNVIDGLFARFKETQVYKDAVKFTPIMITEEIKDDRPPKVNFASAPLLIPLEYRKRKASEKVVSMHVVGDGTDTKSNGDEQSSDSEDWETDDEGLEDPPPENSILLRCESGDFTHSPSVHARASPSSSSHTRLGSNNIPLLRVISSSSDDFALTV